MERLPYIDAYGVEIPADVDASWRALVRVAAGSFRGLGASRYGRALHLDPPTTVGEWTADLEPGAALPGFTVDRVRPRELLSLRGGHRFSRYRFDFELVAAEPGRTQLWARTWAEFPGVSGWLYRAMVIGSGGHRIAVRRMLNRVVQIAATESATPASAAAA
jgi:hypothetical protein